MQNVSSLALKLWEIFEMKDGGTKSLESDLSCSEGSTLFTIQKFFHAIILFIHPEQSEGGV